MKLSTITCSLLLILATSAVRAQSVVVDQSNLPVWDGAWLAKSWRISQTFVPGLPLLTGVDIDILTANPSLGEDTVAVELYKSGVLLARASKTVVVGFDGLLHFDFENAVPVQVGDTYELVSPGSKDTFGWRYGADTYPGGFRTFSSGTNSNPRPGQDQRFQTYGRALPGMGTPSAGQIAFLRKSIDRVTPELSGIYLINSDGTDERQLVSEGNTISGLLKWSPDGSRIAYVRDVDRPAYREIYVANADGTGEMNLTNSSEGNDERLDWSSDGSQIVFESLRTGTRQIYLMSTNGGAITQLTDFASGADSPDWSRDGSLITFLASGLSREEVYVMRPDGSGLVQVTDDSSSSIRTMEKRFPRLSPDGSKVVFRTFFNEGQTYDLRVVNSDGSGLVRLTDTLEWSLDPDWSPDGTRILFNEGGEIYVINADGSGRTRLTDRADPSSGAGFASRARWSPNGLQIAFARSREDLGHDLYVMDADGSNQVLLTDTTAGAIESLDWRPLAVTTPIKISKGGVVSATGTPVIRSITPNSILTLFGQEFAPVGTSALQPQLDAQGRVATNLHDTCVEVNGQRSPMFAVLANQINLQASHLLEPGEGSVVVIRGCGTPDEQRSAPASVEIAPVAPAFFNFVNNQDGVNPIAALHGGGPDLLGPVGLFASVTTTPARPGEFVSLFATGFGATSPMIEAGEIPGRAAGVTGTVEVSIGGIQLTVGDISYAGVAPCCAGLYQLVVRVPDNAPGGNLPVVVTVDGVSSPPGPFIAVAGTEPPPPINSGSWIGNWILVNFLTTDREGIWPPDDLSGIGLVQTITETQWILKDDLENGCTVTFSYSVDDELRFSRQATGAVGSCPAGIEGISDSGRLEFSADNQFMTEHYDLVPGDEIVAFRWLRTN